MRTRLLVLLAATLALGLAAPAASAKIWFPVADRVFVVGEYVRLDVPGCDGIGSNGCIASYPGPVRMYLVRAEVPIGPAGGSTSKPPQPARALGRLGDRGRLGFAPRAAGRFRLVALATVGTENNLRTSRLTVSPTFVVHPRGWETTG